MGAMMGWHPSVTRQTVLHDIVCAHRGWMKANGADPDDRHFGKEDLRRLQERVNND